MYVRVQQAHPPAVVQGEGNCQVDCSHQHMQETQV